MKINSIHIKNYQTLEDLKVNFEGFFSSVSGKNNAGKTTIFKAIKQLFKDNLQQGWWGEQEQISYASSKTQWVKIHLLKYHTTSRSVKFLIQAYIILL